MGYLWDRRKILTYGYVCAARWQRKDGFDVAILLSPCTMWLRSKTLLTSQKPCPPDPSPLLIIPYEPASICPVFSFPAVSLSLFPSLSPLLSLPSGISSLLLSVQHFRGTLKLWNAYSGLLNAGMCTLLSNCGGQMFNYMWQAQQWGAWSNGLQNNTQLSLDLHLYDHFEHGKKREIPFTGNICRIFRCIRSYSMATWKNLAAIGSVVWLNLSSIKGISLLLCVYVCVRGWCRELCL